LQAETGNGRKLVHEPDYRTGKNSFEIPFWCRFCICHVSEFYPLWLLFFMISVIFYVTK
jgi:hypothetical protein